MVSCVDILSIMCVMNSCFALQVYITAFVVYVYFQCAVMLNWYTYNQYSAVLSLLLIPCLTGGVSCSHLFVTSLPRLCNIEISCISVSASVSLCFSRETCIYRFIILILQSKRLKLNGDRCLKCFPAQFAPIRNLIHLTIEFPIYWLCQCKHLKSACL